jgi:hypothetical protein
MLAATPSNKRGASGVSGLLPALGGGAHGVVPLVAGGLSGVLAMSALIASGVIAVGGSAPPGPQSLAISFCKGDRVMTVAQPGEQMLVTGKSADGVFYRVYVPGPLGGGAGWVRAADVDLLAEGPVPLAECGGVAEATGTPGMSAVPATASPIPGSTATAKPTAKPTARSTPSPTPAIPATARPTAKPTPTPNLGPVFTTQPRSSSTTMGTNPLGTGTCVFPTSIEITTAATDPDGVPAIQLWVQKPATTTFVRLGHDFTKDGALWYASIHTDSDGLRIEGELKYYALAFDSKGVSTRSTIASVRIDRCDTEATISGGINTAIAPYDSVSRVYRLPCESPFSIPFKYTITDRDGLASVAVNYTITPVSHPESPVIKGKLALHRSRLQPDVWLGATPAPLTGVYRGDNTVRWTIQSTDVYGGVSPNRLSLRTVTINWQRCVE